MTDKELIKQEIERRIEMYKGIKPAGDQFYLGQISAAKGILQFINSLSEEPASEDWEEENPIEGEFPYTNPSDTLQGEIENIFGKLSINGIFTSTMEGFSEVISHFVKWQHNKEQQCEKINDRDIFSVGELTGKIRKEEEMKDALQTEYEKGRFDMKEEMMKDVVEGRVQCGYGDGNKLSIKAMLPQDSDLKYADKVKVLILKTE